MSKQSLINIVLYKPEIPYNTGNIIRSCATFTSNLHLIRPYGFFINDKRMIRASTDYLNQINLFEHDDFQSLLNSIDENDLIYFLTKKGESRPDEINFNFNQNKKIYLVFGQETNGLPEEILNKYKNQTIRIPISNESRCLNLSNSVACLLYEIYRQNNFKDLGINYEIAK
ncbi:tRNA (uridine(34)/cytosine(34)/5-carboxymethylaminomethyluridine(34)-2'-O)-methyltransferase TrmL [Mycoplasmoides pirum]|uniref:tRNA (uridine(34)/cytosine(34)/5- carboxymethylaminomethyluridine(34)-2'-O)- methyltransferase TrmL n=1 Tax=Mycoplasmoides pirum TaxID=2122 RepID=UPI00056078A3|nr:tRNA (uridine(34)/cytosine(34)/5-carboxymethylaminomethyluridine(34)-2'-O)-methyltransferase TrmL [Mycoplasmoides pirum]